MKAIHKIAWVLVIIGALNWGLAALHYNVVDMIFGMGSTLDTLIYLLVGLSGLILIFGKKQHSAM